MVWTANILTLYPEMFPGSLQHSLSGKALKEDIWNLRVHNIREYGLGNHNNVDEKPAGGGPGMVLRADVLDKAITDCFDDKNQIIYFSPKGKQLTQDVVKKFSLNEGVSILCGHFEGVDQRIIEKYDMKEISVGDYILSGGEVAALTFLDSVVRLLPNVIGNNESTVIESFTEGLLEYPQYTKPNVFNNAEIPEILLSGNHRAIEEWRKNKSVDLTKKRRPDLLLKKNDKI
jgi:tRNA (guanine37-N1)-methyltransferase